MVIIFLFKIFNNKKQKMIIMIKWRLKKIKELGGVKLGNCVMDSLKKKLMFVYVYTYFLGEFVEAAIISLVQIS